MRKNVVLSHYGKSDTANKINIPSRMNKYYYFVALCSSRGFLMSNDTAEIMLTRANPEIKHQEDFISWAAEALDGQMRNPTEFYFDQGPEELIANDGSTMGVIFENSIKDAEQMIINGSPQMSFELRRRLIEMEEYEDMLDIAQYKKPNTMVVVSDYPAELMDYPDDLGGYNSTRKQTLLRVITRQPNGNLHMYSQTLDQSDRDGLESIYRINGFVAKEGELLGQRMHMELDDSERVGLIEKLVRSYDLVMQQKFGGEYYAGRKLVVGEQDLNTAQFVREQADIVRLAVQEMMRGEFEPNRYNTMALLANRYDKAKRGEYVPIVSDIVEPGQPMLVDTLLLIEEREIYGRQAKLEKKTFSGCGITLQNDDVNSAESELAEAGYGNKADDDKEEKYTFSKFTYCVGCQKPPKDGESKKYCGPCDLCRDCDRKAGGKG